MKILVVEDDRKLAATVARGLDAEGFAVEVVDDGRMALLRTQDTTFDLIVLDLMLPGRDGHQVCRALRGAGDWTPILVLTARDAVGDEAHSLDLGADDYLTKPFAFEVLVARVSALLRRAGRRSPVPVEVGDLRIDAAGRRVWRCGEEIEVTAREFEVLAFLAGRPGQVLTKLQILDAVWDQAFDGDPNIVEVYVSRLRRRLARDGRPDVVQTVRGVGYRLHAP